MFRVEVHATPRLETVLDAVQRELAANPREHSDAPLSGAISAAEVDVFPAIVGLVRQLNGHGASDQSGEYATK